MNKQSLQPLIIRSVGKVRASPVLNTFSKLIAMKLILVLAITILGGVSCSTKPKGGGNCDILAGKYLGYYIEPGPERKNFI